MKIRIVTDSVSNLKKSDMDKYQIKMVYLNVNFGSESFVEKVEIDNKELFSRIDNGEVAKTSQPSPDKFLTIYDELRNECDVILSMHLTSGVSGTVQSAKIASEMYAQEAGENDAKVVVIDTLNANISQESLIIEAAKMIEQGFEIEEIISELEYLRENTKLYLTIDDLNVLVNSGRVTKKQALIGNFIKIKPLLTLVNGKLEIADKIRTNKRVVDRMVELLHMDYLKKGNLIVRITSINAHSIVADLESKIKKISKDIEVFISDEIGPVMATTFGRGGYGVTWLPLMRKKSKQ